MTWLVSACVDVVLIVAIFFAFRKALHANDRKSRVEIALILQARANLTHRKMRPEFRRLADLVMNRDACADAARDIFERSRKARAR